MKRYLAIAALLAATTLMTGCFQRIETGEVGLRVGFDKQIKSEELMPGSFNQTLVGDILTFPVKDVTATAENLPVLSADNTTMKDYDVSVIYSINPKSVSDLYSNKAKSFHAYNDKSGDTFLMYNYIVNTARNAAYKAARKHEALIMSDKREVMETDVKETMQKLFADEKLDNSIIVTQVQIRSILPPDSVAASASDLVAAKNQLKQKEVEVQTAQAEARRMAALANQSAQSIDYMKAQAQLNISEAVKNGKVNTIIIPSNLTMLGSVGK